MTADSHSSSVDPEDIWTTHNDVAARLSDRKLIEHLQAQLAAQTEKTDTWQMAFEECRELRSIAEAQVAEMQPELGKLKTDLEHARQLVAAQEAETTRLRLVLVQIQDWDCLNPPDPRMCADHPWLRRLVDNALSTRLDAADVPAEGARRP